MPDKKKEIDVEGLNKLLVLITSNQEQYRKELNDLAKLGVLQSEHIVVLSKENKALQKRVKELEEKNGVPDLSIGTNGSWFN